MKIGPLRQRVRLERPVTTQGDSGADSVTWVTVATVWASVEPSTIRQRERLAANQVLADMDTLIRVRWVPVISAINATWRAVHNETIYNIIGVANVQARNRELELQCKSGMNDG